MFNGFILIQFILHYYTNLYDGAKQGLINEEETAKLCINNNIKHSKREEVQDWSWCGQELTSPNKKV